MKAVDYYPTLVAQLDEADAGETGYARCGMLLVAATEDELHDFAQAEAYIFGRQRALGQGQSLNDVLGGRTSVTEGVYTATAVQRIAAEKGIEMPICSAVCDILDGRTRVPDAVASLMQRPLKAED